MREQVRLTSLHSVQPSPGLRGMTPESCVFARGPTHEESIQRAQGATECRGTNAPVVLNPTGEYRLNPSGNVLQGEVIALRQPPATYPLMHRLGGVVTHSGAEAHKQRSLAVA